MITPVVPSVVEAGISANAVTVAGMALSAAGVFAAYKEMNWCATALTVGRVYADWLDGPVSRCSNNTSDLGDALDHISDTIFFLGMGYVLLRRQKTPQRRAAFMGVVVVLILLALIAYGCQEKFHGSDHNGVLGALRPLCASKGVETVIQQMGANDVLLALFYVVVMHVS